MKKSILLMSLGAAVLLSACGGDTPTQDDFSVAESSTAVVDENVIVLESNDNMQYSSRELKIKAGQEVTLLLKHTGKMSKEVMGHNWVLLKKGVDVPAFANAAAAAKSTDYIPEEKASDIIAYTDLIGGGEETKVTFKVADAGTYEFLCSYPGHFAIMKGKLIVE